MIAGARSTLSLLAAAAVVVAGGCSQEADRLDAGSAEAKVSRAVAEVVEPKVAEVTCPQQIELRSGAEFRCEVVLAEPSGTLPVRVVQRDVEGNLDVVPLRAVLSASQIAESLKSALKAKFHRSFLVECGDGVAEVREPGAQTICRARDRSSIRSVVVTIEDERGTLAFEVVDP
ncbi:MAG: DUF4333 domain-containing protein [Acidimicrobiales bacterium]